MDYCDNNKHKKKKIQQKDPMYTNLAHMSRRKQRTLFIILSYKTKQSAHQKCSLLMEEAIKALKGAMSNDPSFEVQRLKREEDLFDCFDPRDSLHYRKETLLLNGVEKEVRRAYFYKPGRSSAYCNVGWVLDRDCDVCLKCCIPFSVLVKKHHCRVWY